MDGLTTFENIGAVDAMVAQLESLQCRPNSIIFHSRAYNIVYALKNKNMISRLKRLHI